ncbi:MAG TPA: hypothetical protein VFT46_08610 [Holophagaceae bacterium]|nr:hypothetical protein [Holophagaceae bacterium]
MSRKQLTILSGAGINLGISAVCPKADEMLNFTYKKVSESVYGRIKPEIRSMFSPESFDYILGGLLTVNLAIEKTKQDLKRFRMNEQAFMDLFKQSELQTSIADALDSIEEQLTISLDQMLDVTETFDASISRLFEQYNSMNYFTLNFDGIFDHIIYGKAYKRGGEVTDFWTWDGKIDRSIDRKMRVFHLHGDLRYKPFKKTRHNSPPYRWPVVVVGDQEVKKGIIGSSEALRFYNKRFAAAFNERGDVSENNLAIIGFGFRNEDEHIIRAVEQALQSRVFDKVFLFDPEDKLASRHAGHVWVPSGSTSLIQFLEML